MKPPKKKYRYPHPVTGKLVSRQRICQIKNQAAGKCITCGGELEHYAMRCDGCTAKNVPACNGKSVLFVGTGIGGAIRSLRKKAGLRICEVEEKTGIVSPTISAIERHNRFLPLKSIEKIASVFGLTGAQLIERGYAFKPDAATIHKPTT